jgi:hypothetical protein
MTVPGVAARIEAILADFAERGIVAPTPLHALIYAIDRGFGEDVAAALAELVREQQEKVDA